MSVLIAEGLRRGFSDGRDRIEVLRGVDMALAPGEVVALEGPSGSGKSTLLSILGCLLTRCAGRTTICGNVVDGSGRADLSVIRKRYIGFVFQQYNLVPALTAFENVELALRMRGVVRARALAGEALEAVGLGDRMGFWPRELSGGQKQRVAIARAIAGRPPLLLADEPTANLDSATGVRVLELLRSLAKDDGRAVLIVTHDPRVRPICDRVVGIRDGKLVSADSSPRLEAYAR